MEIDIPKKSKELKDFVSQFESTKFIGDITGLFPFIKFNSPMKSLEGLSSPQRQLLYLIGLNITSSEPKGKPLKPQFSDSDLDHMKNLLNEIEIGYEQFFYPKPDDAIDEEWELRRRVSMPTFLSYFNQGLLNYEEQIIERIEQYFKPFDKEIEDNFGLSISEFIDIYNFIDEFPNQYLMENINTEGEEQSWEEFCLDMQNKGIMPPEWQDHLPKHFQNLFEWISDLGSMNRFNIEQLSAKFGGKKANTFLDNFTCQRNESDFLYYTEKNIIYNKPIFKVDEKQFQSTDRNNIIQAVFNLLYDFCVSDPRLREKFYKHRGKQLEVKIEEVFQKFFQNKAIIHKGYFTDQLHEQDLLILANGMALIIEAKASKRDEPRREPDRAYPLILSNFDEIIQKGYDQTFRVKEKFIDKETFKIYRDQKLENHISDIATKKYFRAFSIVVTQERFGQIQTNLSELLDLFEDDEYPWSICIDDLEVFLLALVKQRKKPSSLSQFLAIREKLHGRTISSDELEVCGAFINGELTYSDTAKKDNIFAFTPEYANIFDFIYNKQGLGFKSEKNLEIKTSGKYLPIGGF